MANSSPPALGKVLLSLTSWCGDIALTKPDMCIGRSESCDVVINLPHISAEHCRIMITPDGQTQIQDLSSNGTFIEGQRVRSLRFQQIFHGDTISLSPPWVRTVETIAFVFRDEAQLAARNHKNVSLIHQGLDNFDLQIIKPLGRGSFGEVFLGVREQAKYAVKVVKKGAQTDAKLLEEVRVMERLKFPHIVQIHRVWDSPERILISLEYADGGDLERLLRTHPRFSETDAKSILVQILNALHYLHENRVIHRDLKPENVLLKHAVSSTQNIPHLLLSDFGMSRMFDAGSAPAQRALTICGTPNYVACEIVRASRFASSSSRREEGAKLGYDERVDLWSAGVLLYRLVNGALPWKQQRELSLTDQILAAANPHTPVQMMPITATEEDEEPLSDACKSFIHSLIVGPEHRLSAWGAMQHEWIAGMRRQLAIPASMDQATQGVEESQESQEEEAEPSSKRMRQH